MKEDSQIVVVGDGGLLTWGLGYYLRKAGWRRVVIVGDDVGPKEAIHARGVIDVHPPRVQNHMLVSNTLFHGWFQMLKYVAETDVPPQSTAFRFQSLLSPSMLNWASRMPFYTRESVLSTSDLANATLAQHHNTLMQDLSTTLAARPISTITTDLFLDKCSFGDHRLLLVELQRQGLHFNISASKGSNTGSAFPTLLHIRKNIAGAVSYNVPTYDLLGLSESLKTYCLSKVGGISHYPANVSSFSRSGGKATSVVLADGSELPCDAVVLARGAETASLLVKTGCALFAPLYQATGYVIDYLSPPTTSLMAIPDGSTSIEQGIALSRDRDATDKVRGSGMLSLERNGLLSSPSPSFGQETNSSTIEQVTSRYDEQLHLYARIKAPRSEGVYVDGVALTPDGVPVIGKIREKGWFLSRPSNVYVCCGLGPAGCNTALGAAQILSDMTVGKATGIPSTPYMPERFWFSG